MMIGALLLLFAHSLSTEFPKWQILNIYHSDSKEGCEGIDHQAEVNNYKQHCNENTPEYGGEAKCLEYANNFFGGKCVKKSFTDIDDELSSIDKSVGLLFIYATVADNVKRKIDFTKLPSKMQVYYVENTDDYNEPASI